MLNLDTEEWGEICIGCAGGGDTTISIEIPTVEVQPEGCEALEVSHNP